MGGTWMLAKTCKPKGVPISNLTLLFLETILSSIAQTAREVRSTFPPLEAWLLGFYSSKPASLAQSAVL